MLQSVSTSVVFLSQCCNALLAGDTDEAEQSRNGDTLRGTCSGCGRDAMAFSFIEDDGEADVIGEGAETRAINRALRA